MGRATASRFSLLRTRRFLPLFVSQALGAFNDNVFRNALVMLVTYRLAARAGVDAASLIAIAGALFIAPFFLFSGLAGELADKLDKARLARIIKLAEIGIALLAIIALWTESIPLMLAVLFLAGTQSTFFGPIKYSILPQHLAGRELVDAKLIEASGDCELVFQRKGNILRLTPVPQRGIVQKNLFGHYSFPSSNPS